MPLDIRPTRDTGDSRLAGIRIFLSTSIPNVKRWDGEFDALAITDAVVATGRAVLTEGGQLITAAHPTIAPLLLYLAREVDAIETAGPSVLVYQSKLFE